MTFGYVRKATRRLSLLFGVALTLSPAIAHAQDISTGLVGYWTMDETAGTSISDTSGNGNDGTLSGTDAASATEAGMLGAALRFDGANDSIFIPFDASLEIPHSGGTIAAWVQSDIAQVGQNLYWPAFRKLTHTNTATDGEYQLGFHQSGPSDPMYISSRIDAGNVKAPNTSPQITAGQWYHILVTWDATNVYLYLDGNLEYSVAKPFTIDYSANSGAYIGWGSSGSGSRFADGLIDDVRVYNRGFTAADVTALYGYRYPECNLPDGYSGEITYNEDDNVLQYCNGSSWVAVGPKVALSEGLVGHWELDEGSGLTSADSSVNANDATLNGMEATDWVDGVFNNAVKFDDSTEYLSTGDNDVIGGATEATICTWLNYIPASVTSDGSMVAKYSGSGWMLFVDDVAWYSSNQNTITFTPDDGAAVQIEGSPNLVTPGQWSHFCVTFKGGEYMKLYKDGALDTTLTSASVPATIHDNNLDLVMGRTSSGARPLNAQMDDVRLYDRILSDTEVQSLHDMGPSCIEPASASPVGHWTLDETTGNSIADSSGNGIDGTWSDATGNDVAEETEAGMVGNALHFDGTDDYINIPFNAAPELTNDAGTVMAWVKSDVAQPGQNRIWAIFRKFERSNEFSAGAYQFEMHQAGSSAPMYLSSRYNSDQFKAGTTPIQANQWYHVTMSWDTNNGYLYLDGNIERAGVRTGTVLYDENAISHIGRGMDYAGMRNYADGVIDDVRVYDSILTPTEISAIYGSTGGVCTLALCSNPYGVKGEMIYNADYNVMQYCNGGSWIAMGPPGDGGGGCSSPSGLAGTLRFDEDNSVLMYCEGDDWIAVSGHATNPLPPNSCPNPGDVCTDGTVYAGLTPDGNVPMYTTPTDVSGGAYFGSGSYTTGATSTTDGQSNSATVYADVIAGNGDTNPDDGVTPNAFVLCNDLNFGGHNDWYIPAEDEIDSLYNNRIAIGNFDTSGAIGERYWTSTEFAPDGARATAFSTGGTSFYRKSWALNVRCVRHD